VLRFRWIEERKPLAELVTRAKDPKDALKRIAGFLKAKAKQRMEKGEGFAPLAPSTQKKYAATTMSSTTKRGTVKAGVRRKIFGNLKKKGGSIDDARAAAAKKYKAIIARAARRKKRGVAEKRKSDVATPLGKLIGAFVAKVVGKRRVTVENKVPWSGVHNEGGAVGNGAKLPKRQFLFITSDDLDEAKQIVLDALFGKAK
jgi:phage gpG-like protein